EARGDAPHLPRRALPQGGRGPLLRRGLGPVHPARGRPGVRDRMRQGRPDRGARRHHALVRHGPGAGVRGDPLLPAARRLGRPLHRHRHRPALPALREAGAVSASVGTILTDIEGTVGGIAFVRDVLFPYARRELPRFVRERGDAPEVRRWLDQVAAEHGAMCDDQVIVEVLQGWIDEDRKHTALKALQGMVWSDGYRRADFTAHVYPDAVQALRRWHGEGHRLAVYSSGSVPAQKLFFGHSDAGDLVPLFDAFFDTEVGGKRDPASYARIAGELGEEPPAIVFLSDV